MAGSKVNTYGVGDVDLTNIMTVIDSQRQGYYKVSLTNYDNDSEPEIAAGSKIEINGSLYKFDSDESIGGSPSNGIVLIKLIPSGSSVTAEFTNDLPLWDDEKGGWYEPSTNNRYLHFSMYLDSGDYTEKNDYTHGATGEIRAWPTAHAPWPWVLCDGETLDSVSDPEYARLYHVIGTTFGGSGADDFDLPDLRGRLIIGKDNMGGVSANRVTAAAADSVGGTGGHEDIPYHRHELETAVGGSSGVGATGYSGTGAVKTSYAGNASSTNNMPPYMTMNYIIRL